MDNLNYNITIKRSNSKLCAGIDLLVYDPELLRKLDEVMDGCEEGKPPTLRSEGYMQMVKAHRDLRRAFEQIFPEETKQPYTITIKVEGTVDSSSGPRLY